MKQIICLILLIFIIVSCNSQKYKIYNVKDKNIQTLLKSPCIINESESKKYCFVCSKASYVAHENDKDVKKFSFESDIDLNRVLIKKTEKKWWFIYDHEKDKIIYSDINFSLLLEPFWDEENGYFVFRGGMNEDTGLVFYNLKNTTIKPFTIFAYYENNKSYLFKDHRVISYTGHFKRAEDDVEVLSTCIKIRDLTTDKDIITIPPLDENKGFYELIRWETDTLLYKEKGKDKEYRYELK
jgi:hypothetical protein